LIEGAARPPTRTFARDVDEHGLLVGVADDNATACLVPSRVTAVTGRHASLGEEATGLLVCIP
jgi:hypothetical protein